MRITVDKEVGQLLVPNHMENAFVAITPQQNEFQLQTVIEHVMGTKTRPAVDPGQ